jgi:Na+-translocating ferredoxin:NAD+ oxidoreductase RnfC subunit
MKLFQASVDASHERFVIDHNRCILCTAAYASATKLRAHTWDVMGRGTASRVITDLNEPWGSSETCTSCGKCVHVCPTGALFEKGRSVAEMQERREFLPYLTLMWGQDVKTPAWAAATSIGLTVPTDLSEDQKTENTKLSKLSGKSFDKEYTDLMVKDHTKDLAAFQKAESTTQDPKLKTAISTAIPVIQEHLSMASSDASKLGAP